MILSPLAPIAVGDRVRSPVVFRRADGSEATVTLDGPAEFAPSAPDDLTGPAGLAVVVAMCLHEDLEIEGRIDPDLARRLDDLQDLYLAMNPQLRRAAVRVRGTARPGTPSPFAAVFFSRGVDSMYLAAQGRSAAGPFDAAIFVDALEPRHDADVRGTEVQLARQAAALIGLPLIVAEAPIRPVVDGLLDWEDAVDAGLAWVGHSLSGALGRVVLAAQDSIHTLAPSGASPAVDVLLGSSRLTVEHGSVSATRMDKVAWLTRNRADLLPLLKVCFVENRADNCGRCWKCLHTMAALRAAGGLASASGFPDQVDPDALAALKLDRLFDFHLFDTIRAAAVAGGDAELASALADSIRRSAAEGPKAPDGIVSHRRLHSLAIIGLVAGDDGEAARKADAGLGLVRSLDRKARRHAYGAGWKPPGQVTAELGALMPVAGEAQVPAWVLPEGSLATDRHGPAARPLDPRQALRYCLSGLRDGLPPGARVRVAVRRGADVALAARAAPPAAPLPAGDPAGFLFSEPGPGRVELWSGVHPVTGDQLLASSRDEIASCGYVDTVRLGWLAARAPVTGRLGVHESPYVPWFVRQPGLS